MYAGTDANVFLSLAGEDATMREVQLNDPDATNDWEKGDTNHGVIETEDLGDLKSGTLRTDNSGAGAGWQVDWVKLQSEEDEREWTATVGKWDDGGKFPLLKFSLTNRGRYDELQRQKQAEARKQSDKAAQDAKSQRDSESKRKADEEEEAFQRELDEQNRQLERELKRAKMEAEIAKRRAEIDKLKNGNTPSPGPQVPAGGGAAGLRTLELFGMLNGASVPLSQVVVCDRATGRCQVVPGGRVLVGEGPGDGFGLGGVPGRWAMYYGGRSPAEFGLDADKGVLGSDGSRGWALSAQFLTQVFGMGWRAAIYS